MPSDQPPSFHGIIGRSAPMLALFRRIERVAPTDVTVLILGERGTGKELVARAIQRGSMRRDRPFVIVNCGALPRELLASELFGHERGAFTGSLERKRGLVTEAEGGTLFLDEIGDLSPEAQAMLLRFLQAREVRPLGSTRTVTVDVRVLAATNRDLGEAIARCEFRADLYDRLAEIVIGVPPLRVRREDIPALVDHFLRLGAERHGTTVPTVMPEARRTLQAYGWPGNVRELELSIRRAGWCFATAHLSTSGRSSCPSRRLRRRRSRFAPTRTSASGRRRHFAGPRRRGRAWHSTRNAPGE